MKTQNWFIVTLAATFLAGGLSIFNASAVDNAGRQHPMRGRLLERAKERLGLTDEQTAQIKAAIRPEKENIKSLLERLHEARTGLRETIQAPDATEASVRVAAAKVAGVEADLAVERLKIRGKISPILTDEQRAKLAEFRSRLDGFSKQKLDRFGRPPAE